MVKKLIILMTILLSNLVFGEVEVKIHEPIRFNTYNTRGITRNKIVGVGSLEISTDDEKKDIGKKIVFRFNDNSLMTNRKRIIKVEKISLDNQENEMVITKTRELVKIYVIIDKGQLNNEFNAEKLEGEYIGNIPLVLSLYKKID